MKKRIWSIGLALLAVLLTGCANVGPDDFMGWEMEDLRAEAVQKATWWRECDGIKEEGALTEEQLQTVVSEINRLGEPGVHGTKRGSDGTVGIRLEVANNAWEICRTGTGNKVEIYLTVQDYAVRKKSAVLTELLEQLGEQ